MGCKTGHISHLCKRAPADAVHATCHYLLQSPPHSSVHRHSHMNKYRGGIFISSMCVCVCLCTLALWKPGLHPAYPQPLNTKPQHTHSESVSAAERFIAPMETNPASTFLFNMQGINCLHDKLQPSQLRPCDIYTRVVYKHRCGNIISGFVWRMSRESSFLFALMNHAVTSFHTSSDTFGVCDERASARTVRHARLWWCDCLYVWHEACETCFRDLRFSVLLFLSSLDR